MPTIEAISSRRELRNAVITQAQAVNASATVYKLSGWPQHLAILFLDVARLQGSVDALDRFETRITKPVIPTSVEKEAKG